MADGKGKLDFPWFGMFFQYCHYKWEYANDFLKKLLLTKL